MELTEKPRLEAGEIWLVAFGAAREGEPGKTRPAVVLSTSDQITGSMYDLVMVVPISSTLGPSPVRPVIPMTADTGLLSDSVAVVRAIRGLSARRLVRPLGQVTPATLTAIKAILAVLLDL